MATCAMLSSTCLSPSPILMQTQVNVNMLRSKRSHVPTCQAHACERGGVSTHVVALSLSYLVAKSAGSRIRQAAACYPEVPPPEQKVLFPASVRASTGTLGNREAKCVRATPMCKVRCGHPGKRPESTRPHLAPDRAKRVIMF